MGEQAVMMMMIRRDCSRRVDDHDLQAATACDRP